MRFPRAFFRWRTIFAVKTMCGSACGSRRADGSAAELLENDNEVYALSELLDRSAQDGVLPDMPLYRVTDVLHADGTAILPALRVDAFGQTAPAGTAVFKNERLNCFLDGEIGGGAYA